MPYASIEKRREYQRKWRKEHPDLNRKYKNKHYAEKLIEMKKSKENINDNLIKANTKLVDKLKWIKEDKERLTRRIDRAIEYIEEKYEMTLKDSMENFLDHDERIEKKRLLHILEILKNDFWEDDE